MTLTDQDWEDARDGIPLVGGDEFDWGIIGVILLVIAIVAGVFAVTFREPTHKFNTNPHDGWVDIGSGQQMKCDGANGLYHNVGIIINDPRCK